MIEDRNNINMIVNTNIIKKLVLENIKKLGLLTVKGENIRINKLSLDTAEVIVEGEISSLSYSQNKQEKNTGTLLSKIFK